MADFEDDIERHFKKHDMLNAQVGRLSAAFAFLDDALTGVVAFLLNPNHPSKGLAVSCELSFKLKIQSLRSLVLLEEPLNDAFSIICRRLYQAEENRNNVIHSRWHSGFTDDASVSRSKVTAKGKTGLKRTFEETNLFWFNDVIDEIYTLIPDMEEYVANLPIEPDFYTWKIKFKKL